MKVPTTVCLDASMLGDRVADDEWVLIAILVVALVVLLIVVAHNEAARIRKFRLFEGRRP